MLPRSFAVVVLALGFFSLNHLRAVPLPPLAVRPQHNRTVIPGTWTWKIETNKISANQGDLWWSHQTDTERCLVPRNDAAVAVIRKPFEKIDLTDLQAVKFANDKISGSNNNNQLPVGTVLAVRTTNQNYAKLRVVRYYRLHDFSFPGSEVLTEAWKQFVLQKPDRDLYHLEVEWVLFKAK